MQNQTKQFPGDKMHAHLIQWQNHLHNLNMPDEVNLKVGLIQGYLKKLQCYQSNLNNAPEEIADSHLKIGWFQHNFQYNIYCNLYPN